ncbi:MAG: YebC/PmpR family DNA-binding transcriptional regulator [Victivallales bacterium]|nr:YebC/PmpR family DNA-binding transcriptional regulator [Victivallales bacterium]
MSGHSKWANIKHRKGAADKRKGRVFSRLAKEIMVSARDGGGDPEANSRLRTALAAARLANMPNANVERAIKKGTGELEGEALEEMVYEGYGVGGVAFLVECLSDNRNRTAGEIRMIFDRNNGSLAGSGAVTWMFRRKARFLVSGEKATEEKLLELLIDAGVEDIEVDGVVAEVLGSPDSFEAFSEILSNAGLEIEESGLVQVAENSVAVDDVNCARQVLRLAERLEEQEDVQSVYTNVEMSSELMEQAGEGI